MTQQPDFHGEQTNDIKAARERRKANQVPELGDPLADFCAWLTRKLNLDPEKAAKGMLRGGEEGDGWVVISRHDAAPIRFRPLSRLFSPKTLGDSLRMHQAPSDGKVPDLSGADCDEIWLCVRRGAELEHTESLVDQAWAVVDSHLHGAVRAGSDQINPPPYTIHGTSVEVYEAIVGLRPVTTADGNPGPVRYLIDATSGEYIARWEDLNAAMRRALGSGNPRGYLREIMAEIGWEARRIQGHTADRRHHTTLTIYVGRLR